MQESGLFVYLFHQFDCQWSLCYFCVHGNRVYVCLPALCDNLNVAGKDVQLIVTDFIETARENCTILKSCLASQNHGSLHSEENIGKYKCRDESLSSPNVLPCTNVKPLSFLVLNVCGIHSKMKHPDFLSLISNHDIIAISESKLDDTDAVDVPGYVAFYRIEVNLDGSLVEYYY